MTYIPEGYSVNQWHLRVVGETTPTHTYTLSFSQHIWNYVLPLFDSNIFPDDKENQRFWNPLLSRKGGKVRGVGEKVGRLRTLFSALVPNNSQWEGKWLAKGLRVTGPNEKNMSSSRWKDSPHSWKQSWEWMGLGKGAFTKKSAYLQTHFSAANAPRTSGRRNSWAQAFLLSC